MILSRKLETIESKLDVLVGAALSNSMHSSPLTSKGRGLRFFTLQLTLNPDIGNHDQGFLENPIIEPAKDFLLIPAQKTSADVVLTWPIFEDQFSSNVLVEALFTPEQDDEAPAGGLNLHSGERIVSLVAQFLQNVHTKNPILDVELLLGHTRRAALEGFGNDASSCLVLIACALGSIAMPFELVPSPRQQTDGPLYTAMEQAQSYFRLALLRLGLLRPTITGIQCYFYAGGKYRADWHML